MTTEGFVETAAITAVVFALVKQWRDIRRLRDSAKNAENVLQGNVNSTDVRRNESTANIAPAPSAIYKCIHCGHTKGCVFIPAQCTHCVEFRTITDSETGNEVKEN